MILSFVFQVAAFLATLFVVSLGIRIVIETIQIFARQWRPRGFVVVLVESIYSITEPTVGLARRFIKPLAIGGLRLDLAFLAVYLLAIVARTILTSFAENFYSSAIA